MRSSSAIGLLALYGRRTKGRSYVGVMAVLNLVTAVGVTILARIDVITAALIGYIVQGSVRNVSQPVTIGWTNHFSTRANRATVHSFIGQAHSLGEISGGLLLGVAAQLTSTGTSMTISAVTYALAAVWVRRGGTRWTATQSTK